MKRQKFVSSVCLLLVLLPALAIAAVPAPREFAPVQKGFVTAGQTVLPYAPDRILVKFRESSPINSKDIGLQRGAAFPGGETGITSVDALGREVGALKVSRPYPELRNQAEARRLGVNRWFRIDLPAGSDIMAIVDRYAADPNVELAQPDYRVFPAVVPSDPLYADHWGHNNTAQLPGYDWGGTWDHTGPPVGTVGFDANAQAAWDASQGFGDSNVIIAILDSGVDIDHPDLNLVAGYDFGDNDSNPDDNSAAAGHGTCCAGVAASLANNGRGACGIAPGCRVMPCKCADSGGSLYFSYLNAALYWAADNGADIISMSLGAYANPGQLPATDAALQYAYNAGCLILAATSNDNYSYISYPANSPYVMGIGAASPCGDRKRSSSNSSECNPGVSPDPNGYTCDGERWWGSNYGSTTPDAANAVDVIAPTIVPTTDIAGSGGYTSGDYDPFFNGTSCATPYAAGVCALIKSKNPTWTAAQIRDQLCNTAIDIVNVESGSGWDRYSGYGMVDAEAAVGGGGPVPPVADFSGSPTSGTEPLTVDFTDLSTGSPTSWYWQFGDGGTSYDQNPTYVYNNAGSYTVTLTATNAEGSDDEVKTGYITVDPCVPPTAAFSGSPTAGYAPLTVDFTDESTGATSWSWAFGDGGTSNDQNPTYTYDDPGTYTVELTAYNSCGSDVATRIDYITVDEPLPAEKVYALAEVTTHGTVGGGLSDTYSSDNVYESVTETISDNHPVKTTSWAEHRWEFNLPSGTSVTFYFEGYRADNADGDNFLFEYSTDGAVYNTLLTLASATDQVYSVSVPAGLSGTVYVRVTDTNRSWGNNSLDPVYVDEIYFEVSTAPGPPVAQFSGDPTSGDFPLTVQFTDLSTGNPTSWDWDFGDGNGSALQNPGHEYTAAGTYTVTLTATNPYGSDSEVKTDYITVTDPGSTVYTHVEDIIVVQTGDHNKLYGNATVTICDGGGAPVTGAVVYGFFNAPDATELSGTTGPDGTVTIVSGRSKVEVDFCFEVTDVIKTGTTYDPGANLVTRSCESGDVFGAGDRPVLTGRELPESFALHQNSPNPFNPVTMIRFDLPEAGYARLEIFNVAGQRVKTLVDRHIDAGYHEIPWNAAGHSSGVYFYRLIYGDRIETKKMILLR